MNILKRRKMANSHSTYDKKDKEIKNKKRDTKPYPGWWIFVNVPWRKRKTWIDQYRKHEYENDIS